MSTFTGHMFTTIYGRNLIGELSNFVHRPFLVVTMEDLWEKFAHHFDEELCHVYFVTTIDGDELKQELAKLPDVNAIVGLGGGQAMDTAKVFAWSRRLPLLWPLALLLHIPGSLPLWQAAYAFVAKRRLLLAGRCDDGSCPLP